MRATAPLLAWALFTVIAARPAEACSPGSASGLAACVDKARYAADLDALGRAPRPPGSAALVAARQRCADVFAAAGLAVERHVARLEAPMVVDVIGLRKGTTPGRLAVLVGAHIDSVAGCDGADDNASGAAAVLEMARVFAKVTPEADLYFACWDGEEAGLIGSWAWAGEHRHVPFDAVVNFEMIGNRLTAPGTQRPPPGWFTGLFPEAAQAMHDGGLRGDFAMFVWDGTLQMRVWDQMQAAAGVRILRGVATLPPGGTILDMHSELMRSDHASFWHAGQPAMYITDTGPYRDSGYHCGARPDDLGHVDVDFAVGVVRAATVFVADRVGPAR